MAPLAYANDDESVIVDRCGIPSSAPIFSRSASSIPSSWAITSATKRDGVPLPELIVDGWKPSPGPVSDLLRELLTEASIPVIVSDTAVNGTWSGSNGTLTQAVDDLVTQMGGSWSYDGKIITISNNLPVKVNSASFNLPEDRDARLATIDILRAFDVDVSFDNQSVTVSGSIAELDDAKKSLRETDSVNVFDVSFLRGRPEAGRYDWNSLGAISSKVDGAGGNFIFTDSDPEVLINKFIASGDLVEESAQSVATPTNWSIAIPPSQCGSGIGELIVSAKNEPSGMNLSFNMPSIQGDFGAFPLGALAVSASSVPVDGWITIVIVRPRIVRFNKN